MTDVRVIGSLLMLLSLGGCMVGPDHQRPQRELAPEFATAAALERSGPAPRSSLWSAFQDPDLDRLLAQVDAANTSIAQAEARLQETRALAGLARRSIWPSVQLGADLERSQASELDPFIPPEQGQTNTYRLGFDSSWELDLFGGVRREREAIEWRAAADLAALDVMRLRIRAELVHAYVAWRGAQARLAVQRRQISNLEENLGVLRSQVEAGRGTDLDVSRSRAVGLSIAAAMPDSEAEVSRQEQRIAALCGWSVAELRANVRSDAALPQTPELLPIGTPEDWLRRRPDVREAEWRLAEQVAQTGVVTADLYPRLTFSGGFGYTTQSAGDLGRDAGQRWRAGPSLNWSFLDHGRVRQRILAQQARAAAALAHFDETLLQALEETENALATYHHAGRTKAALAEAVSESRSAERLARLRHENGASSYLVVLDAQRSLLDFEDRLAQAETREIIALVALYKALAGDFAGAVSD